MMQPAVPAVRLQDKVGGWVGEWVSGWENELVGWAGGWVGGWVNKWVHDMHLRQRIGVHIHDRTVIVLGS